MAGGGPNGGSLQQQPLVLAFGPQEGDSEVGKLRAANFAEFCQRFLPLILILIRLFERAHVFLVLIPQDTEAI